MSLFSVFDPVVMYFPLNWISLVLVILFIPLWRFSLKGSAEEGLKQVLLGMEGVLRGVANPVYVGLSAVAVGVLVYLVLMNMVGLFPFVFTGTAHPVLTLGVGLVCWFSFASMGWGRSFSKSAAHLVPESSPVMLAPLLVLIESISHLMRPFTLSLRLAANMMAGHLIVGLLSSISLSGLSYFFVSFWLQTVLMILEGAVAVIQGLVFSILLVLYALEYY